MREKTYFEKLLQPGQIGKVQTKNRIVKTCGGAEDVGDRNRAFLEAVARGGTGLIIWGDVAVEYPRGVTIPITARHFEDNKYIPLFAGIAEAVHKYGCPIFMQLFHAGPQAFLPAGLQTISSSSLTDSEVIELTASMKPKELTVSEIEDLVDKFAETAVRARKAGFDGVEVNAARMHLLNSFLSRAWNKRRDRYGCTSLENRCRFLVEIIREIKNRLGSDFPVSVLINGRELKIEKGTTVEEAQGFAVILQNAGIDAIHVRAFGYHGFQSIDASPRGIYYSEIAKPLPKELDWSHRGRGAMVPLAAAVKKVVSIPVIAVGALDPFIGEQILQEGKADFIGICKGLMADPEIANKVVAGKSEDIAPCTDCGDCARALLSMVQKSEFVPIRCRVNAALGSEPDYRIPLASKKKKVVVVGGGPAGMEVARVLAIRGHNVILYEKENRLGGLLPWVAVIKGPDVDGDATVLANYLENQIRKCGVEIKLGKKFDAAQVSEINPDAVILATGGIPEVPVIPGISKSKVISVANLCQRVKDDLELMEPAVMRALNKYWEFIGKNVVIIGGTVAGSTLAEFLVERCRNVTIVAAGSIWGDEPLLRSPALEKVVRMHEVQCREITDSGLIVATAEGKQSTLEADTIITALDPRPDLEFAQSLEGKVPEIYLVGWESNQPRSIMNAIGNAYRVGRSI